MEKESRMAENKNLQDTIILALRQVNEALSSITLHDPLSRECLKSVKYHLQEAYSYAKGLQNDR